MTCQSCVDKIVKKGKQCVACDGRAKDKDLVELKRDGTGFAAAGGAEAVKVRATDRKPITRVLFSPLTLFARILDLFLSSTGGYGVPVGYAFCVSFGRDGMIVRTLTDHREMAQVEQDARRGDGSLNRARSPRQK